MTGPANALEFVGLDVWFDPRDHHGGNPIHTVKDLSLTVAPGERVGLVGESGCGKTTTILAALGLLPPTATVGGQIRVGGRDILAGGEAGIRAHRWTDVAMVFQGAMSAFNPVMTVGRQIREALEIHGIARGRRAVERTRELLDLVGLAPSTDARYPHQLSGGMKQRAVIAMALACEPKVLLADEPTTALDVVVQDQVLRLLVSLSEELGLALVLVTHDLGVVAQACTRAAVMRDGRIVEQGTVEDLYRRPAHPYTRQLFESTPDLAAVGGARESPPPASPLLEVTDLRVTFGDVARPRRRRWSPHRADDDTTSRPPDAVADVSMTVGEGELVALVGQSGCGKTTTLQAILGMQPVRSGSIRIGGTEITTLDAAAWRPLRRDVQMIYQDPYEALDGRLRVADTVAEPLVVHRIGSGRRERRTLAAEALRDVGLDPAIFADRFPHELSGGQRQRVAIAASLVLRPRLLLADEPVSMLDVSVRTGVLELLDALRREHRMGILMITHDLSTAAAYADRIIVMRDGAVVEAGAAWQVVHEPRADYTRTLLASVPSPDPARRRS
ncbi:MAG: ABC transporter ATP-binding protein [Mycobacterium kyogaense]|uniref:ABC transporter ATP-binding protein n=1 Tax=Mycobacterium kyogaense TaxID=2212479 RepID=UPI002FF7B54C